MRLRTILIIIVALSASVSSAAVIVHADSGCGPNWYSSNGICLSDFDGHGGGTGVHGVVRM
jgi:hypothetical protein